MRARVRVEDVTKELRSKAAKLIAGLALLKIGIDPDKNKGLLQETIGKTEIDGAKLFRKRK